MNSIKLLLIEDNQGDVRLLQEILQQDNRCHYVVETRRTLNEGIQGLKEFSFDIVLLDISLPDSSGLETFHKLYEQANTPIIILTGIGDEAIALNAMNAGAQDYLIKDEVTPVLITRAIAYAIERYRLQSEIIDKAITDDLTGLYNRRGFLTLAEQQIHLSQRLKNSMVFFFIDLNGLKKINDQYGHQAGDRALIETAKTLKATFRDADILSRLAGDEFAVLAIDTQKNDIENILERLKNNLTSVNASNEYGFEIGLSLGYAEWSPQQPKELDILIKEADAAMYAQKRREKGAEVQDEHNLENAFQVSEYADGYQTHGGDQNIGIQTLLLVEDNPADARLIRELLRDIKTPFELVQVSRLSLALEKIAGQQISIILLDLSLPDSHGLSTLETIVSAAPHSAVIVMTGNDNAQLAREALQLGAQDYLQKGSFDEFLLERAIQYAVERNKLRIDNIRVANQLRQSESRFKRVIDDNVDGILILNQNNQVLLFNRAAELLFEKSETSLSESHLDIPVEIKESHIFEISQNNELSIFVEIRQVGIFWQGQNARLATLRDITDREFTKRALEESQERLQSIFNNVSIGMYRTTPKGEILFANPCLLEMLGYKNFGELVTRDLNTRGFSKQLDHAGFNELMESEDQIVGHESVWIKKDGAEIHIRESAKAIRDLFGEIVFYEGTAEDITHQIEAERHMRLQAAALDAAANAILITDNSGVILWVNPAFSDLTGYSSDEAIGAKTSLLKSGLHDDDFYKNLWETVSAGMVWQGSMTNRRKNGTLYHEEMTITPLVDANGEISQFIAIKQDISARKQADDTLHRQLDELWVLNDIARSGVEVTNEDELITKVTQILSESFYPEHFGILMLDHSGQYLDLHPSYKGIGLGRWPAAISLDEGIVGTVVTSGKPARVPDVSKVPKFISTTPGIQSNLSVPLSVAGRIIGVINAESTRLDAFSAADERLLTTVAGQLATAIEQIRNQNAEHEQRLMAEALRDSATVINSSLSFDKILDQILDNIARVVPYEGASLMLNEENQTRLIRHRGFISKGSAEEIEGLVFKFDQSKKYQLMMTTGKPIIIEDVTHSDLWQPQPGTEWIRSYLGVSIQKNDQIFGFLNLDHSEVGYFTEMHANALTSLANQLAIALENSRLFEETQQRASELDRLYKASGTLLAMSPSDPDALGKAIVETVRSDFGQSNCSLLIIEPGKNELNRIAKAGPYVSDLFYAEALKLDGLGLVPTAIRNQEIINIPNVLDQPNYVPNWKEARSEIAVPLIVGGRVIGAIDVQSADLNAFSENDVRIISVFAERAALALDNANLYERQQSQLAFLESLRQIDLAITGSMDIKVTLDVIMKQVIAQLKMDAVNIFLLDPYLYTLNPVGNVGFRSTEIDQVKLKIGEGLAGFAAQTGQVHFEPDLSDTRQVLRRADIFKREGFKTAYIAPLLSKGQVKGVMELFSRQPFELDAEWEHFAATVATQTAIAVDNATLFENLQRSYTEISMAYDTTLEGWAKALELRDHETVGHSRRVVELTMTLARSLNINNDDMIHVRRGALLHDIGKMGVPDRILQKPGPLTDDEWVIMRRHPSLAYEWLSAIRYLRPALDIPYFHHERWDGSGYPIGLQGEQIPLSARIFAVIDVWDALTSDRPYRKAWEPEKVFDHIRKQTGTHFDPQVVDAFFDEIEVSSQ